MKKHIMLIENDQQGYSDLMEALQLMQVNCKVTYIIDYERALQMLQYFVPDFIFMHINLAEAGTLDCIRRLREHTVRGEVRVVAYDDRLSMKMVHNAITQCADHAIDKTSRMTDVDHLLKGVFNSGGPLS